MFFPRLHFHTHWNCNATDDPAAATCCSFLPYDMILHQINPNLTTACGHVSVQHECLFSCKLFKRGVGLFWGTCSSVVNPNLKVMPDISCWCLQEDPHCPSMFWNHARLLAHKHTSARTCSCIITSIIKDYPPDLFIFRCPWHKPQVDDLWPPPLQNQFIRAPSVYQRPMNQTFASFCWVQQAYWVWPEPTHQRSLACSDWGHVCY